MFDECECSSTDDDKLYNQRFEVVEVLYHTADGPKYRVRHVWEEMREFDDYRIEKHPTREGAERECARLRAEIKL